MREPAAGRGGRSAGPLRRGQAARSLLPAPLSLGASRALGAGGQAASASGAPLFNNNGFTASLHIAVILYKQG